MKMEPFEMERMQSTWENIVEYDLSESGIRAVSLRELFDLGFELDQVLDTPPRLQPVQRHRGTA